MNSIFEQLCKSIIRELFELMRKIKRGKIMLKHKDFFVKSAEMFKTRLICEINKLNIYYIYRYSRNVVCDYLCYITY